MVQVSIKQAEDRQAGVSGAIAALDNNPVRNKDVLIKPNFNTADPADSFFL